jgi:hypothetical protein
MDEEEIRGNAELAAMNDEELFACAEAAEAAGDQPRAAECFGRIVDLHPQSRHFATAALRAGMAWERQQRWELAHERWIVIAEPQHGRGAALDAAFGLARANYHLQRYAEAAKLLATLAARSDLSATQRLDARVQQAICELEAGNRTGAETMLRDSLETYEAMREPTAEDTRVASQAQFFVGELYRLQYDEVQLVPDKPSEELGRDLELKAQLLLSAQGHYLRSIRMGNAYWGTAAGAQIGAMYQDLYERLVNAPAPRELDAEAVELYRQEVRKRLRVLLSKAINVYERTLEAAERIGSSGHFVERTRESLDRMKALMVAESAAEPESAPAPKSEARPRPRG